MISRRLDHRAHVVECLQFSLGHSPVEARLRGCIAEVLDRDAVLVLLTAFDEDVLDQLLALALGGLQGVGVTSGPSDVLDHLVGRGVDLTDRPAAVPA